MTRFAPRIPHRLIELIDRLDDESVPLAEVCRRVGREADRLLITRPSYERLRVLIHASRDLRAGIKTSEVLVDIAWRSRCAPEELLDQLSGTPVRKLNP